MAANACTCPDDVRHEVQLCQSCRDAYHADMADADFGDANDELRMIAAEAEGEVWAAQYDDDPSPYDGTYSEI